MSNPQDQPTTATGNQQYVPRQAPGYDVSESRRRPSGAVAGFTTAAAVRMMLVIIWALLSPRREWA